MNEPPSCLESAPSHEGDIPAGSASAIRIATGERIRIINHLGQQVVDTWVFVDADPTEFLSMEHCRGQIYKLFFGVGDVLISNRRRPLVRIVEDTSPGRHDTLCSACDAGSYAEQGQAAGHPNCKDNLLRWFESRGIDSQDVPCPWNLFMEILVDSSGRLSDRPSSTDAGQFIELQALADIVVVCSPCPQVKIPISGVGRPARGVRWQIA